MTNKNGDSILQIITLAKSNCGLASFKVATEVMSELWQGQDEHSVANRREPLPTWIDVLREQQDWSMFS